MQPDGNFVAGAVVVHALDQRLHEADHLLETDITTGLVLSGRLVAGPGAARPPKSANAGTIVKPGTLPTPAPSKAGPRSKPRRRCGCSSTRSRGWEAAGSRRRCRNERRAARSFCGGVTYGAGNEVLRDPGS